MANFYADTISKDPRFHSKEAVHDVNLLEPTTRDSVAAIIADAAMHGISLTAFETYRSTDRQIVLYDKGATKLRNVGVHHYGLAADLVRVIDGQPSWKGDFDFLGHMARAHGLIWGGDWGNPNIPHSFPDVVHVQRCSLARQGALFAGVWYPDASYDPYSDAGTVR